MKNFNLILKSIIMVCVLTLSLSVAVLAENSEINTSSTEGTESVEITSSEADLPEGTESSTSNESGSLESDTSSAYESFPSVVVSVEGSTSSNQVASSNDESSKKQNVGNVGSVNDGIDTSGWGDTPNESVGTASGKSGSKKIMNLAMIIWFVIWIPILLIIGSIVALVYVNRKGFVDGGNTKEKANTKSKKLSKTKSGRENIYRPRD